MKIIPFKSQSTTSPFRVLFSLKKQIEAFEKYALDETHPYSASSKAVLEAVKEFPELRDGIEDLSQLSRFEKEINMLLNPLFPDPLQSNEIKSVIIPFKFVAFHFSQRFQNILEKAGPDYELGVKDMNKKNVYIFACSMILKQFYKVQLNLSTPLYIDIPNQETGGTRHYRGLFNIDAIEITKTDKAPELTQADIDELLLRAEDLEFWKSKFPVGSYIMKGFGLLNLFDMTDDVILSRIRSVFLRNDPEVFEDFKQLLRTFMGIKDLEVGYSLYDPKQQQSLGGFYGEPAQSIFLEDQEEINYKELFYDYVGDCVIESSEIIAISDVDWYGKKTSNNLFYQKLKKKKLKSLLMLPLKLDNGHVQLLEMASYRKNELNSLVASKLMGIIPFVKIAAERYIEESQNVLESTIQENYTSIHPSVKWRFSQAAAKFNRQMVEGVENPVLDHIVFKDIYPLYAQSDIKGSSVARNSAIQTDLSLQLSLVIKTFETIMEVQSFPIYYNLVYRVQSYLNSVEAGLKAGDEVSILEFLRLEIYPVFDHLKTLNPAFEEAVAAYMSKIDPNLYVVYQQRKSYEDSVNMLNDRLAAYLDKRQEEAQTMFPHYFERYKTDGVEFNMYIGASLVGDESFNIMYLHNLRLWQLQTMCELEQVAYDLVDELPYPLRVASLILIHSNPLAIRFRMEQKQFDVDGAYNARYEIVKKRIDKSHIKGTDERLTQPGKIAIVYSQAKDAFEYIKYLEYLQSEGLIGEVERLDLEDLQGVSGLKALRAEVLYKAKSKKLKKAAKNGNSNAIASSKQATLDR